MLSACASAPQVVHAHDSESFCKPCGITNERETYTLHPLVRRPLAGTRPRGATPEEDLELERDLLADEKERAEHVMLVDLGRNDVGRVCRPTNSRPLEPNSNSKSSPIEYIFLNYTFSFYSIFS